MQTFKTRVANCAIFQVKKKNDISKMSFPCKVICICMTTNLILKGIISCQCSVFKAITSSKCIIFELRVKHTFAGNFNSQEKLLLHDAKFNITF